jgi:hypothetical protein
MSNLSPQEFVHKWRYTTLKEKSAATVKRVYTLTLAEAGSPKAGQSRL